MSKNSIIFILLESFIIFNFINCQEEKEIYYTELSRTISISATNGMKFIRIRNPDVGKLINFTFSFSYVNTSEILYSDFKYKNFDYLLTYPEITFLDGFSDINDFSQIKMRSSVRYTVLSFKISVLKNTTINYIQFRTEYKTIAPITSVSSTSLTNFTIPYSMESDDYYFIMRITRSKIHFSFSSNTSISKISYIKSNIIYTDEEILDISYNSLSNKEKELSNKYYNYQGDIDNSNINEYYNYIILKLRLSFSNKENANIYLTETENAVYEIESKSYLLIILIIIFVIIVICVICVVIFVFHKGFLKKKENNEKKEKIIEENVDDNIKGNKVENSLKEDEESD